MKKVKLYELTIADLLALETRYTDAVKSMALIVAMQPMDTEKKQICELKMADWETRLQVICKELERREVEIDFS